MKASLYHTFRVPCRVEVCEENDQPHVEQAGCKYGVSEGVVARFEPEGAVLLTQNYATPPIFVDSELANQFRNKTFGSIPVPETSFSLLSKANIIKEGAENYEFQQATTVKTSGMPFWGAIEVTSKCNCDCQFCYHKEDLDGFTPKLSDVLARIDKMLTLGITFFEVTGGEALLRKDLFEIISHLNRLRVHYILVTNGEFLKDAQDNLIDLLRLSHGILVSIDGIGAQHDQIRQRTGLYNKILQGLERLKGSGVKLFFNSTLFAGNVDSVPGMIELAQKYDTTIQLRPAINTAAVQKNRLEAALIEKTLKESLHSKGVYNAFASTAKQMPPARYYGCNILKNMSVDARGRIFPCIMDRSRQMGNLMNLSMDEYAEIITGERQHFLDRNEQCKDCRHKIQMACGGFCRFSKTYKRP